ncbi:MAG: SMC-Scp complex subunit ScpB, partial [Methanosarcinaceae archaeon]|nr:SMC-Scp complex subunit ScpB [Methanosarcinaceae archaeon]
PIYAERKSGLEILDLGGRYVMQVNPDYSELVQGVAPGELSAPKLRTLSMIAYHQPLLQTSLVEMRGGGVYEHIRELIERGFVDSRPEGRTRVLFTTPLFADYFGLKQNDPVAIKEKILGLLKDQVGQSNIESWVGKKTVAVSPMYESLMEMCGIKDYLVLNPYSPSGEEITRLLEVEVLIITAGYLETVRQYCDGEILEVHSTTFEDLREAVAAVAEELAAEVNPEKVEESLRLLKEEREKYISAALLVGQKVKPATDMISRIVNDMNIGFSSDGVLIAPDYGTSKNGGKIGEGAEILVPTHRNVEGGLLERVCSKYDAVLEGLKRIEETESNTQI